jgi:streptogramin lyase
MKTKMTVLRPLVLAATAMLWRAVSLPAQTPPAITTQPASQTNLAGSSVTFSVAVSGAGPFIYQWQFNGANLPNNIITTVAGNGTAAYSGDHGHATNASLNVPDGVAADAFGNLFIADTANNRIRKVDANGIITTVAGNGTGGFFGDGGYATNACFSVPVGMALDATGDLYLSDYLNQRIRRVDINGIITTVAGNGALSDAGDGGPATNASLFFPAYLALDAVGNLYITENNLVRRVDTNGVISTFAGDGGSSGTGNGDGGPAIHGVLDGPTGVGLDAEGNVYIAEYLGSAIRKVGTNGIITSVAGFPDTNANFNCRGIAVDAAGDLYIADSGTATIYKMDTNGNLSTVAGNGDPGYSGDGGPATNASLLVPFDVALDPAGNLYVADRGNNRVREVHFAGLPTLSLTNVSAANAGNYSVVVTSPYGSVTSAVTTLNVAANRPQIMTSDGCLGFLTNQFGFNLGGDSGQTIIVDASTNFVDWTPLSTNPVGATPLYFCDPAWTNFSWRFYRARLGQ